MQAGQDTSTFMTSFSLLPTFLCVLRDPAVNLLAVTTSEGWRPGIGDPTFLGWLTVFAYFAAAVPCALTWRHEQNVVRDPLMARSAGFLRPHLWLGLSILLVLLGFNKQLDLQSALSWYGRRIASAQGWYEYRRIVQGIFIVLFALGCLGGAAALAWYLRASLRRYLPALLSTIFLLGFVIIRAASFHHVDVALQDDSAGIRFNGIFELGGIAAIAGAALVILKREGQWRWPRSA